LLKEIVIQSLLTGPLTQNPEELSIERLQYVLAEEQEKDERDARLLGFPNNSNFLSFDSVVCRGG
jgi:hypothetical protein